MTEPTVFWLTAWIRDFEEAGEVMCMVDILAMKLVMPPVTTVVSECWSVFTAAALADLHCAAKWCIFLQLEHSLL